MARKKRCAGILAAATTACCLPAADVTARLWSLTPEWYREHWLPLSAIGRRERLAHLARGLGWQDIKVADNADNDARITTTLANGMP